MMALGWLEEQIECEPLVLQRQNVRTTELEMGIGVLYGADVLRWLGSVQSINDCRARGRAGKVTPTEPHCFLKMSVLWTITARRDSSLRLDSSRHPDERGHVLRSSPVLTVLVHHLSWPPVMSLTSAKKSCFR
jgi:hypothetical protein